MARSVWLMSIIISIALVPSVFSLPKNYDLVQPNLPASYHEEGSEDLDDGKSLHKPTDTSITNSALPENYDLIQPNLTASNHENSTEDLDNEKSQLKPTKISIANFLPTNETNGNF